MTSDSPGIIRLTHAFTASAERVFDAWISPEKVARWLLPDAAKNLRPVEIDARADGSIRCVTYSAGRAVELTLEYHEIRRPYRLSFTIRNSASAGKERVTVLIEPRGAGCCVTLTSGIERAPLRALAPLAALAPFPAEKVMRPRWPTLEAKAVLSLGMHLAMLPLLPIVLREPEPPPEAAFPPPAMITVDVATAAGVKLPGRLDAPATAAPGDPAGIAPPPPSAPAAPAPMQQSPAAAPRPDARTNGEKILVLTWRTTRLPNETSHVQGASGNAPEPRPLNWLGAPSHSANGPEPPTSRGGAAGESEVLHQRTRAATAYVGPPLVGTICSGTVSLSPDAGFGPYYGGRQVSAQARFFRDQQGSPWVRFTLWPGAPWNLPVTISGGEIRWTGVNGNGYALRPAGNDHLTGLAGFTNDSAAQIDFTCAGSNAHPT